MGVRLPSVNTELQYQNVMQLNVGSSLGRRFFSENVLEALKWHNHRVALKAFVENQQDGLTSELQI